MEWVELKLFKVHFQTYETKCAILSDNVGYSHEPSINQCLKFDNFIFIHSVKIFSILYALIFWVRPFLILKT